MAFYSCSRLANKQLFATVSRIPGIFNSAQSTAAAAPKVSFKPFQADLEEHYDDKNARLNRPMSPHLTIYAPQITSMLSITHRIAGMTLAGYFGVLGIGTLVLPQDISSYIGLLENLNLSPSTIFICKAIIASPIGFHFANGLRHLYWDTGRGLTLKEVYGTGYAMLVAAAIITLGLAAL